MQQKPRQLDPIPRDGNLLLAAFERPLLKCRQLRQAVLRLDKR